MSQILFFGRDRCKYSNQARNHLEKLGFEIEYITSKDRNENLPKNVKNWQGEYIFCFRSFYILPKDLIDNARIAAINFHPGSPEYPGSGCLNFALYENAKSYGATAHLMNEKVDNGKIIECTRFSVLKDDNVNTLLKKTHKKMYELFCSITTGLSSNGEIYLKKKLKLSKNEKWTGIVRKLSDLNKLQIIEADMTKEEIIKRIRAFHTDDYPIKINLHKHNFILKK